MKISDTIKSLFQQRPRTAVGIPEHAVVEFTHEVGGHPAGTVGVVMAYPEADGYTVELGDGAGGTVDLVDTRGEDLRVTHVLDGDLVLRRVREPD
jgi:hypothetical protein